MKTALLIMAAGIGSRFGGGIKQLAPVGLHGEIIMDYSIHDAIEAGFNKIIFVIRRDIEADFRAVIGDRIEAMCAKHGVEVAYAFQRLDDIPEGFAVPEGRTKPWGTGQAILAARDVICEPFAVINADDYYGKEAFVKIREHLVNRASKTEYCMAGFVLKNTLSENGGVTRGVCQVDETGYLQDIVETHGIVKTAEGAEVDGKPICIDSHVSMNMWGLVPEFVERLKTGFVDFFREAVPGNPAKAEYLLPTFIGQLLRAGEVSVKVLETTDKWFGVTYQEDKAFVMESFRRLIEEGVYQENLFDDL